MSARRSRRAAPGRHARTDDSARPPRRARATRATGADTDGRTRRWPALLVLPLLVLAAVGVQRHQDDEPVEVAAVPVSTLMPTASAASAPSSTWYCAAGTALGASGTAEQTIEIANVSDQALTAHVTGVPTKGDPVSRDVALPAQARQSIELASIVNSDFASAVVEADGGLVVVSHTLKGPTGTANAACSSAPSDRWYFPSGSSVPDTSQLLFLFNPFPSDAVVGVTFETNDGARAPQEFGAIVVPGQHLKVLDVSGVVPLRTDIATTVAVRSGRLIVDQLQSAGGTQGTTKSLALTPGAPEPYPTWWFADGPASVNDQTSIVVQNPNEHDVDVELQIRLDDADVNGDVEPFAFTVPAGRYVDTNISADGRVPAGIGFTAVATSSDGSPIVASRVVTEAVPEGATKPLPPSGVTVTLGSPALATRWVVPVASAPPLASAAVILTNPSDTDPLTVTLSSVVNGTTAPIAGMDQIEIPAGGRGGFPLPGVASAPPQAVVVEASAPVVVEARLVFDGDKGIAAALAVPISDAAQPASSGLTVVDQSLPVASDTVDPNAEPAPDDTLDPSAPTASSDSTDSTASTDSSSTTTSSGG